MKVTRRDLPAIQGDDVEDENTSELEIPVPGKTLERRGQWRGALVVLRGIDVGRMFLLEAGVTTLGRDREAHVHYDEKALSRHHARIVHEGGRYFIEDLDSRNGTYVDGDRITRAELRDGVRVMLSSSVVFRFNVVDEVEQRATKQLFEASTRDALTGIHNRRYFDQRLAAEVSFAHRHKGMLGLVLLDVDHFKSVNDAHGHLAGDAVLVALAQKISGVIRVEDVFGRYGGEELVILVRGIPKSGVATLAGRVRRAVEETAVVHADVTLRATVSAGIAALDECDEHATGDLLLALADERLYRAKRAGRNRVCAE
jgi:two-component system cell cycle response regulator